MSGVGQHGRHIGDLDGVGIGGGPVRVIDVHVVVVRLAAVLVAAVPRLGLLGVGRVDEDVVLELRLAVGSAGQHLAVLTDVDGVVVDVVARTVARQVEHAAAVVLRDVVAERRVDGVLVADHQRGERVAVRVVVLVQRAVAVIGVPRLAVAVAVFGVEVVVHLVVLEDRVLAAPGPDARRDPAAVPAAVRGIMRVVDVVHVLRDAVAHVVLDDRTVAVHEGDGVAARTLDVVVLDGHVGLAVLGDQVVVDAAVAPRRVDEVEVRGVAHGDAPAVHVLDDVVLDGDVIEARDVVLQPRVVRGALVLAGVVRHEVDAAVGHVLVVDVAVHVVDVQTLKRDMAHRGAVLRDAGHAGAVHAVGRAVELGAIRIGRVGPMPRVDRVVDVGVVIGDLQVLHRDVRHVLEQDGRGDGALVLVVADRRTVVLVPLAALDAVRRDDRLGGGGFAIIGDGDGRVGGSRRVLDVQILVLERGATLQQHGVARLKVGRDGVDLVQRLPGMALIGAGVAVIAMRR